MRRDYRGVLRPTGVVVMGLGVGLALCAVVGWLLNTFGQTQPLSGGAGSLAISAGVTLSVGFGLFAYGRRFASDTVTRREAVLSVALIWLAAGMMGSLPFAISGVLSPLDAFFEAMSGLTTTGATVVTDIEQRLPRPLLLWRSLLQWLGGMGIVVLFVAVFPSLGAGGKHMFKGEVPGASSEGLKPRIAETSFTLWRLYTLLTVIEAAALIAVGMGVFEAVCHAFTTMSTGGFSTRDASIAAFENPAVEYVIAAFMLIASVNFGLYYGALRGRTVRVIIRSLEFRTFVAIVAVAVVLVTMSIWSLHGRSLLQAFRYGLFTVATFASSTGYGTDDYMAYPAPALGVVLALMLIGGSSGSTAGGIKVERLLLMAKQSWAQIRYGYRPNLVTVVRIDRRPVERPVLSDVAAFLTLYLFALAFGVFAISVLEMTHGITLPAAFGAMLSCLSNMGPAPFHLGADHFAGYSAASKVLFILAMLLGRLEFFTLLALLVPSFWKR